MAENIDLVNIDLTAIIKQSEQLTDNIFELEEANKKLRKEISNLNDETDESVEARKQLNLQISENKEQLKDLKKEQTINQKLLKSEVGSINQLKAAQQKLIKERQNLNVTTEQGKKRLSEINQQLRENQDAINESSEGFANFTGNMEELKKNTGDSSAAIAAMQDSFAGAGAGIDGLAGKFKAFLANPWVIIFTAIAGAIVAIGQAMKNSRAGSVLMQKGMAEVSAGVDVAKKRVNEFVEDVVTSERPITEAAKKYGKALIGVPLVKFTKNVITGEKKLKDLGKSFNEERKEIADVRKELIDLNNAFIDIEDELLSLIAVQRGYGEIQGAIADDATRSFQETRAAAEAAAKADKAAAEATVRLSEERLALAEKEIELGIKQGLLRRTAEGELVSIKKIGIDLEKSYTEAKIANIEAENQLAVTTIQNRQRINQLKQDDFEQELDFLLDIADRQKTVNEQNIADTRLAFSERRKILDETNKLIEKSYDDQLALYESELGVQLDRNKLSQLNNKEIFEYARGLGLSEIATNRLREVIMERRQAVQDLTVAERDLNEEYGERSAKAAQTITDLARVELESAVTTNEELKDLRLAWAEEDYENALERKDLLDAEKIALELQYQEQIKAINEDFASKQLEEDKKQAKERAKVFQEGLRLSQSSVDAFFVNAQMIRDTSYENEIKAAGENEEKKEEINKKFNDRQKKSDIAVAGANTALAIVKAYSQLGPLAGTVATAILLATLGSQVAKIRATDYYAKGGEVRHGVFKGPSHAQGGIDLYTGSGQHVANVEGNEGFYVVNKIDNSRAVQALSDVNSKHGRRFSTPVRYAQAGGEVAAQNGGGMTEAQFIEMLQNVNIFVRVVDINNAQGTFAKVVSKGEV